MFWGKIPWLIEPWLVVVFVQLKKAHVTEMLCSMTVLFSKLLLNPTTVHKDGVNVHMCVLSRTVQTHRSHQDMQCT